MKRCERGDVRKQNFSLEQEATSNLGVLGARTLLVAPGLTTKNKRLLASPGAKGEGPLQHTSPTASHTTCARARMRAPWSSRRMDGAPFDQRHSRLPCDRDSRGAPGRSRGLALEKR